MDKGMNIQTLQTPSAAYIAPVRERTVRPEMAAGLKVANEVMLREAGVTYKEVYDSLHGDFQFLRVAVDAGLAAADQDGMTDEDKKAAFVGAITQFVNDTVDGFKFVRVKPGEAPTEAGKQNRAKAAILGFQMTSGEWHQGPDGLVTKEEDGGLSIMREVKDRVSGWYGFGIAFCPGAYLSQDGTAMNVGEYENQNAAFDIAEALEKYRLDRENGASLKV